ncbi:DUF6090 family protein [Mucilaginibacter sp. X4EP1]|uniref:DUF6090 family protein n=1 Tax=Mucilaginibacter sp. X4EP1 TaxID=2723092 RepID=UPI0021678647|nr:DUF6090 family protein [Mucilaginibacter sp. X4EP1]MCS3816268.1 hypothetical protein [Mucilaginibacter sp. X4EP1]
MSEEKIIKHTEAAVRLIGNKEKPWRKKIGELAEEIAIIIFAVSITLALHNWNDWRNERKMEKDFLTGIKGDLKNDAINLDYAVIDLNNTAHYYDTVWQQIAHKKLDVAYIDTNSGQLLNTVYFRFDNGRFESFKSSGYLRLIENQVLLKNLTNLYTSDMPFQVTADDYIYGSRRADYNTYIGVKAPMDAEKVVHVSQILNDPAVRYQLVYYGSYIHERIRQKKELAKHIRSVITEIDKELDK